MEDTVKRKTVYFEEHYNVNIDDFKSTDEIDEFIEKKTGKKLEVKKIDIFPIKKYEEYPERDIDYVF